MFHHVVLVKFKTPLDARGRAFIDGECETLRKTMTGLRSLLFIDEVHRFNSAQQDELNRQILLLDQRFRASPQRVKSYETLQQRLSVARDSYASYIRARETYRLEQARATSATRSCESRRAPP